MRYTLAMPILGHGVDLVETRRIARMLDAHGERFLARCFTGEERAYAEARPKRRIEHLAGRFAAKEAVLKALGTGWSGGVAWTEVEVLSPPTEVIAPPRARLHGRAAALAHHRGITRWWISISHVPAHAIASAIAER